MGVLKAGRKRETVAHLSRDLDRAQGAGKAAVREMAAGKPNQLSSGEACLESAPCWAEVVPGGSFFAVPLIHDGLTGSPCYCQPGPASSRTSSWLKDKINSGGAHGGTTAGCANYLTACLPRSCSAFVGLRLSKASYERHPVITGLSRRLPGSPFSTEMAPGTSSSGLDQRPPVKSGPRSARGASSPRPRPPAGCTGTWASGDAG
ncbi:hypothetical protein DPEC_G00345650 [Dallia pectoralis]|uniref:Uncharacterized protein n=1 Tax=Dallia pectoralis TaxID=75939 RepID=A0ACC2F3K6_DALPE|nr:hypothetical protein DPEC_G00345650 [Dallia pectoralis]